MAKIIKTITLDPEVAAAAKAQGVNVSDLCNTFLRHRLLTPSALSTEERRSKVEAELLVKRRQLAEVETELSILTSTEEIQAKEEKKKKFTKLKSAFEVYKNSGAMHDIDLGQ